MKHALAPVAALLIGVSILLTGQGLQGTLLPVRASLEAFSTVSIGTMGAAYFLGFTLGCLRGGELVGRVGHVRVFLAMTAIGSSAPLIHGLFLSPLPWALLRMISGFCFAVLYVVIESWLNERSTNENRGLVFSTYVTISLSVLAAGQMMTLLYDPVDFQLFAIASVLVSLGALPVALVDVTFARDPAIGRRRSPAAVPHFPGSDDRLPRGGARQRCLLVACAGVHGHAERRPVARGVVHDGERRSEAHCRSGRWAFSPTGSDVARS